MQTSSFLQRQTDLQNRSLALLYDGQRAICWHSIDENVPEPMRQLAYRVKLLSSQQRLYGSCDHARNEAVLVCYRELRHVIVHDILTDEFFKTPPHTDPNTPPPYRFEYVVGVHLSALLLLASTSVVDGSSYSHNWLRALAAAHNDLRPLVHHITDRKRPQATRLPPTGCYTRLDTVTQQQQIAELSDEPFYKPFVPAAANEPCFFLAPLLLVGVWPDGTRRNFDLAPLITQALDLPDLRHAPVDLKSGEVTCIGYVDCAARWREMIYNVPKLQHELSEVAAD